MKTIRCRRVSCFIRSFVVASLFAFSLGVSAGEFTTVEQAVPDPQVEQTASQTSVHPVFGLINDFDHSGWAYWHGGSVDDGRGIIFRILENEAGPQWIYLLDFGFVFVAGSINEGIWFSDVRDDSPKFTRADMGSSFYDLSLDQLLSFPDFSFSDVPHEVTADGYLVFNPGTADEMMITPPSGEIDAEGNLILVNGTVLLRPDWEIDSFGNLIESGEVVWRVPVALLIDSQPASSMVPEGGVAVFSVQVDEGLSPSFRWQSSFDGGDTFSNLSDGGFFGSTISGTFTDTLTVSAAPLMLDGLILRVEVTVEGAVAFSDHATLNIVAPSPPVFLSSPVSRTVEEESSVEFSVFVDGFPEPSVRWQVSTDGGATFADLAEGAPYSGVDTTTLAVHPTELAMDGYRFRAVAESSEGTVESASATLTVTPLPSPPAFTSQPQNQSVAEGAEAIFSAEASGHPAPAFQWQISFDDGNSYSNITDSSFGGNLFRNTQTAGLNVLSASSFVDGALFRVRASNSEGQAFSDPSRLTVFTVISFDEWLAAVGVPVDLRDPMDRHGLLQLTNLEAYGMGLSPFEATEADLPRMEHPDNGSGVLQFHYRVNTRAEGVSVSIEGSTDLVSWSTVEPLAEIVYWENDGIEGRTAAFAADTIFLRLRIGEPEA